MRTAYLSSRGAPHRAARATVAGDTFRVAGVANIAELFAMLFP